MAITRKTAFLRAYAKTGAIKTAASASGIERSTHYRWISSDPSYAARFAELKSATEDRLLEHIIAKAETAKPAKTKYLDPADARRIFDFLPGKRAYFSLPPEPTAAERWKPEGESFAFA